MNNLAVINGVDVELEVVDNAVYTTSLRFFYLKYYFFYLLIRFNL